MITFTMDMALKRLAYQISLVNKLAELVLYQSIMVNTNENESRIVNKSGQIVGVYIHG